MASLRMIRSALRTLEARQALDAKRLASSAIYRNKIGEPKPRTLNREPRTLNREPGTGNREPLRRP